MTWNTLTKYWQENIRKNLRKISVIIGDIIITIFTIMLFTVKADLDIFTFGIMILFAIKPYFNTYISLVFKGEADMQALENTQLKQTIVYDREIAEYRVILAAKNGKVDNSVIATKEWNNANEALKE